MTTWHPGDDLVAAYVDGRLDEQRSGSIEAHLLGCEHCRDLVTAVTDPAWLTASWQGLAAMLDAPQPTPVERLLTTLHVPGHVARLLAATPSLSLSWIGAVAAALAFATAAVYFGTGDRTLLVFLGLAPLVPVIGVAAAYGPRLDPLHEVAVAAPMQGWRLLELRAVAVLTTSCVLSGLASLALPRFGWLAVAWLLPALGATLLTVALSTFVTARTAALLVGVLWLSLVGATAAAAVTPLEIFGTSTQAISALVAAVAFVAAVSRRETFDLVRP